MSDPTDFSLSSLEGEDDFLMGIFRPVDEATAFIQENAPETADPVVRVIMDRIYRVCMLVALGAQTWTVVSDGDVPMKVVVTATPKNSRRFQDFRVDLSPYETTSPVVVRIGEGEDLDEVGCTPNIPFSTMLTNLVPRLRHATFNREGDTYVLSLPNLESSDDD